MSVTPARLAANAFSLIPPIGSTFPLSVISPVMASAAVPAYRLAVTPEWSPWSRPPKDHPLESPPRVRECGCRGRRRIPRSIPSFFGVRPNPAIRGLYGLLHHLSKLAGHRRRPAFALHLGRLDKEHVPASRRPGQAHSNSRSLGALGNFAFGADSSFRPACRGSAPTPA